MTRVEVRPVAGKQLLCRIGRHQLFTDRKPEDGGADTGCTSGELLLAAIGSCATGSIRTHLTGRGLSFEGLAVAVGLRPSDRPEARDTIVIEVAVPRAVPEADYEAIRAAATSGGVVSRLLLGSAIEVLCHAAAPAEATTRR